MVVRIRFAQATNDKKGWSEIADAAERAVHALARAQVTLVNVPVFALARIGRQISTLSVCSARTIKKIRVAFRLGDNGCVCD
jgi:flavin-binding protein dodecin